VVEPEGRVVGVDMTEEMLGRSRAATAAMGLRNVEFRQGVIEDLRLEDGSADVVISNGVIYLCADERRVFAEVTRVLKPRGRLQFADIANGKEIVGARQRVRRVSRRGRPSRAGGGTIRTPARSSDRLGPDRSAVPRHAGRRAGR
jgi:ubiquinone/menaquinone biosynthesis C-methylase UbiE